MKKLILFSLLLLASMSLLSPLFAVEHSFKSAEELERFFRENDYNIEKIVAGQYFRIKHFPPDFGDIYCARLKKDLFHKIVLPLALKENERIAECRHWLKSIHRRWQENESLNKIEETFLNRMLVRYRLFRPENLPDEFDEELFSELFKRVNVIPTSLILAQAANESGWGSSRFVLKANNIFGQWTFNKSEGLKPSGVDKTARHRVRIFPSLQASVRSYMLNLNTHSAYEKFRRIRASAGDELDVFDLVEGLEKYSQRGMDYVREIARMIEQNEYREFDEL